MEKLIDVRAALEHIGKGWKFGGSVTDNTESAWNAVIWEDTRSKPEYATLCTAYDTLTINSLFSNLRSERDTRIYAVLWMRERHADELELGKETSLTPEQYTELLTYIQALRDLPAQPGAPWDGGGDLTPWPELPSVE